jgi:hypothetical protein
MKFEVVLFIHLACNLLRKCLYLYSKVPLIDTVNCHVLEMMKGRTKVEVW